jgi:hypothetical protein
MAHHSPLPCWVILVVAIAIAHLAPGAAYAAEDAAPAGEVARPADGAALRDEAVGSAELPRVDDSAPTAAPAHPVPRVSGFALFPQWLCLRVGYCPKPEPCIACGYRGCCLCYQAKPLPCPPPCAGVTCGGYCCKPVPCILPVGPCPSCPCQESP